MIVGADTDISSYTEPLYNVADYMGNCGTGNSLG